MDFTLANPDGRFMPDNRCVALLPVRARGHRGLDGGARGASSWTRFRGWVKAWGPSSPAASPLLRSPACPQWTRSACATGARLSHGGCRAPVLGRHRRHPLDSIVMRGNGGGGDVPAQPDVVAGADRPREGLHRGGRIRRVVVWRRRGPVRRGVGDIQPHVQLQGLHDPCRHRGRTALPTVLATRPAERPGRIRVQGRVGVPQ